MIGEGISLLCFHISLTKNRRMNISQTDQQENASALSSRGSIPPSSAPSHQANMRRSSVARMRMSLTELRQSLARNMSMQIPTHYEEKEHVHECHGEESVKAKILHFIHSPKVQYTLMALLLLDVLVLFIELYLDAEFPSCFFVERDAVSCCPSILEEVFSDECSSLDNNSDSTHLRLLAASSSHDASICEYGSESNCPVGCDPHQYQHVEIWHMALFSTTMIILSTFMIELLVLMALLKPSMFFTKVFYVIDLIIVSVSIALESIFYAKGEEVLQAVTGIIIFARCWRFIRIGHGLIDVTHEYAVLRHGKRSDYEQQLEALLKEHGIPLPSKDEDSGSSIDEIQQKNDCVKGEASLSPSLSAVNEDANENESEHSSK